MDNQLLDRSPAATAGDDRRLRLSSRVAPRVLAAPAFVLLALFVAAPAVLSLILALFDWEILTGEGTFVGFDNFARLLADGELGRSVLTTVLYGLYTVPVSVGLGLAAAVGITSLRRGQTFWRAIYFLPTAATLAAMAVVWRWLFYPDTGLIDSTVGQLTGTSGWLSSPTLAVVAVAVVGNWQGIGFAAVIFLAGLAGVPRRLYEAAVLDGARAWHRFVHVTLPAIAPATVLATITTTVSSLKAYDQIAVLTDGGPARSTETLTFLMWRRGIDFLDVGGGAVVNVALLVVTALVTCVLVRFGRRGFDGKDVS